MVRETTDKEGGREVVGRSDASEGRGVRHDLEKTKGRGAGFISRTMDHEPHKSPFKGIGGRETTRREGRDKSGEGY
jgi:hypothetical protein